MALSESISLRNLIPAHVILYWCVWQNFRSASELGTFYFQSLIRLHI